MVLSCGVSASALGALPEAPTAPPASCLPLERGSLSARLATIAVAPTAAQAGREHLVPVTRGMPRFMAAFNAGLAWLNTDCSALKTFAAEIGYEARELFDDLSGTRHWIFVPLLHNYNGVFVLRAPGDGRPVRDLLIVAPRRGYDLAPASTAPVDVYLRAGAAALLMNTAHPCNLTQCAGCVPVTRDTVCGGCARVSDSQRHVENLLFAMFASLSATRKHIVVELHGARGRGHPMALSTCAARIGVGEGLALPLPPLLSSPPGQATFAARLRSTLAQRLGAACACDSDRVPTCGDSGADSVFSRIHNQASEGPFDPCAQVPTRFGGRFAHVSGLAEPGEVSGVSPQTLAAALVAALAL